MTNFRTGVDEKISYMQIMIDSDVKRKVKVYCARKGVTLKDLITGLLTDLMSQQK